MDGCFKGDFTNITELVIWNKIDEFCIFRVRFFNGWRINSPVLIRCGKVYDLADAVLKK